ncbi:MAG: [Fe-Fe] hydrogenase large subunit C-terminal domain-containing protein, partial [Bacillota bacterium]|nr:[Fe-Fe] hydrogenase large subunit C-terminal domain-containing protein [Bacillota bacterium]
MKQPIKTIEAKCKDCHRCIRACPVKAISLRHGQAQVVYERCITCGLCVSACPQKAKTVNSRVDDVLAWLRDGADVVASLAPSFPAAFSELDPLQVLAGIKAVGFLAVEETATAAADVAIHYQRLFAQAQQPFAISSCCPVVVNLVEMYYPELIPYLAPSVSPMVWHSHLLQESFSKSKIVFIGPCAGKIQEATRVPAYVDAVLTFRQLREVWQKLNLNVAELPPVETPNRVNVPRLYPLSRGILTSSALPGDDSADVISVSGIDTCMATFGDLSKGVIKAKFVEALACREGCIGGTEIPCDVSLMTRRAAVLKYHQACTHHGTVMGPAGEDRQVRKLPTHKFSARRPDYTEPSEEAISSILRQIGKLEPEDQRNCGGCGYDSCRDKAIATYHGLAELEMCVPYMKAKFESLSHLVVESSMDGVIVVNKDMTVYQFNPSAQRMFNSTAL